MGLARDNGPSKSSMQAKHICKFSSGVVCLEAQRCHRTLLHGGGACCCSFPCYFRLLNLLSTPFGEEQPGGYLRRFTFMSVSLLIQSCFVGDLIVFRCLCSAGKVEAFFVRLGPRFAYFFS
jgi:hypothetical protein